MSLKDNLPHMALYANNFVIDVAKFGKPMEIKTMLQIVKLLRDGLVPDQKEFCLSATYYIVCKEHEYSTYAKVFETGSYEPLPVLLEPSSRVYRINISRKADWHHNQTICSLVSMPDEGGRFLIDSNRVELNAYELRSFHEILSAIHLVNSFPDKYLREKPPNLSGHQISIFDEVT